MAWNCEVCQGREQIRLPVYRRLALASLSGEMPATIEESFRTFPCPACSPWAEPDRVNVVSYDSETTLPAEVADDPQAIEHIQRNSAYALGCMMMKQNLIRFERVIGDPDRLFKKVSFRGTAGVVSRSALATIEERIETNQGEVADEVVKEAVAQISNWGSFYGRNTIGKADAITFIAQARDKVRAARKERSTMLKREKHAQADAAGRGPADRGDDKAGV